MMRRLLQTSTFRLTLLYLIVFGVSVLALFGFIYTLTLGSLHRETNSVIAAQVNGLADVYVRLGMNGLVDVIQNRTQQPTDREAVYLLTNRQLEPLAGNLSSWPADRDVAPDAWVQFDVNATVYGVTRQHTARARLFTLPGGERLLVGRDIQDLITIERRVKNTLGWVLLATMGLGIPGGIVLSRRLLRRIERITRVTRRISQGDLSQRLPVRGVNDEVDQLAEQLNDMLERIERLMVGLRTVTDSIAHDLRSPLTHLRSHIELTLSGQPDLERYRAALEQALGEADKVTRIFDALISIARAESGVSGLDMEVLDLAAVAREVLELYEAAAEAKPLRVDRRIADAAEVFGKRQLLAQALANLLDNAIKYAPAGSVIEVSVRRTEEGVDLIVADRGPGIAPQERALALERFVRLDAGQQVEGTGLGLSLVAAVVKLHHGRLALDDNAPGLRVTIGLPAVAA